MATKKTTRRPAAKKTTARSKSSKPAPAATSSSPSVAVDAETRRLEAIVELFGRSDVAELEYEDKDISLKLSRYPTGAAPGVTMAPPPATASYIPPPSVPAHPTASAAPIAPEASVAETHTMKSPFVGTFYRSPGPEAPPFTEVGQRVSKGQTLCIIEAMKLMNEIPSDVDGRIVSVLVDNGEPVQFGDPLFEIAVK